MRRRYVSFGILGGLLSLALGGSALANDGFGMAGTNTFTDVSAEAGLSDGTSFAQIFVDRGMQTFKIKGTSGPPVVQGPKTVLTVFVETLPLTKTKPPSFEFGCWIIPDLAFTVANGLASATLSVGPTQETPCPGKFISPAAGGRPGLSALAPLSGSAAGDEGNTLSSVTLNLTWTSNGAIASDRFTQNSSCQTFISNAQGDSQRTFATVAGTVSVLSGTPIGEFAAIRQFDATQVINGTLTTACIGGF